MFVKVFAASSFAIATGGGLIVTIGAPNIDNIKIYMVIST